MELYVKVVIVLAIVIPLGALLPMLIPIAQFAYGGWQLRQLNDSIPDSEVVKKTNGLPEVKAFISKYPTASVNVDKSLDLVVTYSISKSALEVRHEPDITKDAYLQLNIWLHVRDLEPQQISLICLGEKSGFQTSDVVRFLELDKELVCFQ